MKAVFSEEKTQNTFIRAVAHSLGKRFLVLFFKKGLLAFLLSAGGADAQPASQTCVDVQVGTAQSYDCLNQKLQATARQTPKVSSDTAAPYNATSPGNVTGQFNESATRNRLGANFGHSVTPQRPVTSFGPAFAPPHR